jgi:hypothetical protein
MAVKFAAVVESDGRMVTGKFRKICGFEGFTRMENGFKPTGGGYSFYQLMWSEKYELTVFTFLPFILIATEAIFQGCRIIVKQYWL